MIIRLQNYVLARVSLFNDPLEVDREILAVFASDLHFAFVCEITKTAGTDHGLAGRVIFIGRDFLWALGFD